MSELEGHEEAQIVTTNRLKKQLDALREESKQGEVILVTQLKELRHEKDVLRSKYDFEML